LAAPLGARNLKELPRLTITQVLAWARAHRRRTGAWPTVASGPIREAPAESWRAVHAALVGGYRGLPAGLTLARLIGARPTAPLAVELPRLTAARVLAWSDAHRRRIGAWPRARAGPVAAAPGETRRGIDQALRTGQRGLAGGLSLFRLLAERRGVRMRSYAPPLQRGRILAWARAHRRRTGAWPTAQSGPIAEAPGETWRAVSFALELQQAAADGDYSGAARIAVDLLDLANSIRRGGLVIDLFVSVAVASIAINLLRGVRGHLGASDRLNLIRQLTRTEHDQKPLLEIIARDRHWQSAVGYQEQEVDLNAATVTRPR
jgi:hypothetical protein